MSMVSVNTTSHDTIPLMGHSRAKVCEIFFFIIINLVHTKVPTGTHQGFLNF
jgi:hypothetical protein